MSIGHGQPGLKDFLRPFGDLVDDSQASRRAFLDFSPGIEVTTWAPFEGDAWGAYQLVQYEYDGLVRDVVGVETSAGPLTRVQNLADCVVQPGTFYSNVGAADADTLRSWDDGEDFWDEAAASFDAHANAGTRSWDDGADWWDEAAESWDDVAVTDGYGLDLYVHLPAGEDPSGETVVALLGFHFAGRGEVHPVLGDSLFTNGGFESTVGLTLTASGTGFYAPAQDTALFVGPASTTSLELVSTGAATGNSTVSLNMTTVAGEMYRLAGYYRTDGAFSTNLATRLLVGDTAGTTFLHSDGRDASSSGGASMRATAGEWRRFFFDVLVPTTSTTVQLQLLAASSPGAGQLNLDGITFQPIYSFAFYDPRLGTSSVPDMEVGSREIFYGAKTVGLGNVSIINADGALDVPFGELLISNRPMRLYVGGNLSDGQEIYREDWRAAWPGVSRNPKWTDAAWAFEADDERSLFAHRVLPERKYDGAFPNVEPESAGKVRPLAIIDTNIAAHLMLVRPIRIDVTAEGYGVYEIADQTDWPYGTHSSGFVSSDTWGLSGSTVAVRNNNDQGLYRKSLADNPLYGAYQLFKTGRLGGVYSPDITPDDDLGRFTVEQDVRPVQVGERDAAEDVVLIDFSIGGGALAASYFFYDAPDIAFTGSSTQSLATAMTTAAGATITVSYSNTTHLLTISKATGTLSLLLGTGANRQNGAWKRLGFTGSADLTGSLSYTADTALFTDVDTDHLILMADVGGTFDDADGTITGTALASVKWQTDAIKLLFRAWLGWPAGKVDDAGFAAARLEEIAAYEGATAAGYGNVWLYLDEPLAVGEILARLEVGLMGDITIDGDGVVTLRTIHSTTVSASFFDRDYLSFDMAVLDERSTCSRIEVQSDYSPFRGSWQTTVSEIAGAELLYGNTEPKVFQTYLAGWGEEDDPVAGVNSPPKRLAAMLAALATATPRIVTFEARSKLVDRVIGDKVNLSRTRAPDPTGALDEVRFRILSLSHNYMTGVSRCTAVEDVDVTA